MEQNILGPPRPQPLLSAHLKSELDSDERVLPIASWRRCLSNTSCMGSFLRAAASHSRGPSSSLESLEKPPMCQWPTEVLGERCLLPLLPLLPQPPRLDGDLQLQVQFSLIGEGRRTHRAGVVQEAETGEAEETCRGPGVTVHLSLPTLLPGFHPTPSLGGASLLSGTQ